MLHKVAMTFQKRWFIFTATIIVMEVHGEIEWDLDLPKHFMF